MRDVGYIDTTIEKIWNALEMHRSAEITVLKSFMNSLGFPVIRETSDRIRYSLTVLYEDPETGKTETVAILRGFGLMAQSSILNRMAVVKEPIPDEIKKAMKLLEKDGMYINLIQDFMHRNDMVDVKRMLPELKPFMHLVENERKVKKEAEIAEWRKTYETCIELFGDLARG